MWPCAELGREAGRIAGDGGLARQVQRRGWTPGWCDTAKPSLVKKVCQNGQQLVHVQAQRDADGARGLPGHRLVASQQLLLVVVEVQARRSSALPVTGLSQRLPEMNRRAVGKGVHGELAVVAAAAARARLRPSGRSSPAPPAAEERCSLRRPCCAHGRTAPRRKRPSGRRCPGG